ncbi:hypothetical protein CPB85DRAFT_103102 [Mucidula mucida]|nr:hypothetical protein CPB85DRAFT_103102 [Mucidula mucida]
MSFASAQAPHSLKSPSPYSDSYICATLPRFQNSSPVSNERYGRPYSESSSSPNDRLHPRPSLLPSPPRRQGRSRMACRPLCPRRHRLCLHRPRLRLILHIYHPPGHALSVFYASLIGGSILVPPVCIACDAAFQSICPSGYRDLDMASILWMEYVPRALIIPVFVGGSALGLKILGLSSAFDAERLVDRGHLVAASALGGFIFQVIYEALRAGVVITTLIRERGERNSI